MRKNITQPFATFSKPSKRNSHSFLGAYSQSDDSGDNNELNHRTSLDVCIRKPQQAGASVCSPCFSTLICQHSYTFSKVQESFLHAWKNKMQKETSGIKQVKGCKTETFREKCHLVCEFIQLILFEDLLCLIILEQPQKCPFGSPFSVQKPQELLNLKKNKSCKESLVCCSYFSERPQENQTTPSVLNSQC